MKRSRLAFWIFFAPVFMWLFLLIVLPHLDLLTMSFMGENDYGDTVWTIKNYMNFFNEPVYWYTFVRTAMFAILTTFITFLLAMPVSFYIAKLARTKVQGALMIMLLLPFWVSELVRIYGWMILLRESGVLNYFMLKLGIIDKPIEMLYNDASMIMGLVYTSMLFMIVPLVSVMESLDDSLIEAAHDLGAGSFAIWRTIILPHCKPGITSGSIVVFMLALGNYLTPNLMGGKNSLWFTEQIYNQFIASFNWNQGAAFGFLLLLLSSLIIWVGLKLTGQKLGEVAS
ncbi:ABC transporter permease [Desulfovibrio gilichinskyi]|uniref:Spermidine/putrescine transport system permease protein n=1 Tax=Desulfovibrio gilichinskyi TaxID=1519643 RepID=A0A1X7CV02_9BACT|nr:ABC transporter permease [Desulfovibrio gilichinskyi]SMF03316.1 spermidine/putrescine transport system permease protein [Desulfovibrio gilichinskyi]